MKRRVKLYTSEILQNIMFYTQYCMWKDSWAQNTVQCTDNWKFMKDNSWEQKWVYMCTGTPGPPPPPSYAPVATTYITRPWNGYIALSSLKKAGLNSDDLVLVYWSLVTSVIEYASTIREALPSHLEDLLESIQSIRKPYGSRGKTEYTDAMAMASLDTLKRRRVAACQKFIINALQHLPLMNVIPFPTYHECEYSLHSCNPRLVIGWTNRLNDLVTVKYQHIVKLCMLLLAYLAIQLMMQLGKINKHLSIYQLRFQRCPKSAITLLFL